MPCRGVDRRAMRTGVGNVPDLGERVEVIDGNVSSRAGAGDIKVAAVRIGGHVIESAIAPDHLDLEDFVRAVVLGLGGRRERNQNGEHCNQQRLA